MLFGSKSVQLEIRPLSSCDELTDFYCGVDEMDDFIHEALNDSISGGYCKAFIVLQEKQVIAFYALNFDALILDPSDKEDMKVLNLVGVKNEYSSTLWDKVHYPALEISYLAVRKDKRNKGIGISILAAIYENAIKQDLAGCQFLTVEAYKRSMSYDDEPYSAIPFYQKFGFWSIEEPNPAKKTVRMCIPLPFIKAD